MRCWTEHGLDHELKQQHLSSKWIQAHHLITPPCDASVMVYVMCLLRRNASEEVERAFLTSIARPCHFASCHINRPAQRFHLHSKNQPTSESCKSPLEGWTTQLDLDAHPGVLVEPSLPLDLFNYRTQSRVHQTIAKTPCCWRPTWGGTLPRPIRRWQIFQSF